MVVGYPRTGSSNCGGQVTFSPFVIFIILSREIRAALINGGGSLISGERVVRAFSIFSRLFRRM